MKSVFACFANDDAGTTSIEYGLIAALVSVVIVSVLTTVGANLGSVYKNIGTWVAMATSGSGT